MPVLCWLTLALAPLSVEGTQGLRGLRAPHPPRFQGRSERASPQCRALPSCRRAGAGADTVPAAGGHTQCLSLAQTEPARNPSRWLPGWISALDQFSAGFGRGASAPGRGRRCLGPAPSARGALPWGSAGPRCPAPGESSRRHRVPGRGSRGAAAPAAACAPSGSFSS